MMLQSVTQLVHRMEWRMFVLVFVAIDILATEPNTKKSDVNVSTKNYSDRNQIGLQTDCEGMCQLCNATAKLEKDGSCTCLSDNGGPVECAHFPRYKKELKQSAEEPHTETEERKDTEREERCLGLLGSSKITIPAPANSLQDVLGDGLLGMSPGARAEEIRRRVDFLRATTITNIQKALAKATPVKPDPITKLPGLKIPTLPTSLPLSPFIGTPNQNLLEGEDVLGRAKAEESEILVKDDNIYQKQIPIDEPKLEVPQQTPLNLNIPNFTFGAQIPLVQSGSGIYTPPGRINLRIPQMTANFLPQQLRMQPTTYGGFENYRREGRVLRSSGPFVHVQSPIIPNPSIVYDSLQSSSTDTIPIIDQASEQQLISENKTQDTSESKSPMSQSSSSTSSQFDTSDFTQSIFKVAGGDLTGIGKLVDSTGAEKKVGSLVQGLIQFPKEDQVTPQNIDSNTE